MNYLYLTFSILVLFAINSGLSFAATAPVIKITPRNVNVTVTSKDCAKGLEQLRVMGLKEMKARRDAAFAQAKLLRTNKERHAAKKKAESVYKAEMTVAARQLQIAKAICTKPIPEKKSSAPIPPKSTTPAQGSSTPALANVAISNFSFRPSLITVKKGTTVVWTNNDGVPHTVSADTNLFGSDLLSTDQNFKFTFNTVGSFPYHCQPHRSMVATVEVVE